MSAGPEAPLPLDHLVYAAPDLATAVKEIEAALGVAPAFGGRHEGLGTHNAILPLRGRCYLEVIAPDPHAPKPAQPRPFGLDDRSAPRLVTWAARTVDIERSAEAARKKGCDPGAILALSRALPEGGQLAWQLSLAPAIADGLVPFLIDWGRSEHPGGASAVCSLEVFRAEHPEPDAVRAKLAALGVALEVGPGSRPRLVAELQGPSGKLLLD